MPRLSLKSNWQPFGWSNSELYLIHDGFEIAGAQTQFGRFVVGLHEVGIGGIGDCSVHQHPGEPFTDEDFVPVDRERVDTQRHTRESRSVKMQTCQQTGDVMSVRR